MSERPQLLFYQDILESGTAIQSYVQGMTCDAFVQGSAVGALLAMLLIKRVAGEVVESISLMEYDNLIASA